MPFSVVVSVCSAVTFDVFSCAFPVVPFVEPDSLPDSVCVSECSVVRSELSAFVDSLVSSEVDVSDSPLSVELEDVLLDVSVVFPDSVLFPVLMPDV